MNFDSAEFLLFFPIVICGTYLLPADRLRHIWVLAASYFVYAAWDWRFLTLIWLSTAVAYAGGIICEKLRREGRRVKPVLTAFIVVLLLPLAVFKYFGFFQDSLIHLLQMMDMHPSWPLIQLILPIGISFYTFQAISYVVDVSGGVHDAERDVVRFALFKAFFPQLIAGPIVRASEFLPQLHRPWLMPDSTEIVGALARFTWGFFKKVYIADRLALSIVDPVFAAPGAASPELLILAVFAFGLMIYADFSGYSDMAIAGARLLGFRLPENFLAPYTSTSVREFWRRWHVTLSRWIRDYIYIPLGGSHSEGAARNMFNLLVAMGLCGLWHGAQWTFVAWGLWHGIALAANRAAGRVPMPSGVRGSLGWMLTTIVVLIGWLLFRAPSFQAASEFISAIFHPIATAAGAPIALFGFVALCGTIVYVEHAWLRLRPLAGQGVVHNARLWRDVRVLGFTVALVSVMLFLSYPEIGQRNFIYFQF